MVLSLPDMRSNSNWGKTIGQRFFKKEEDSEAVEGLSGDREMVDLQQRKVEVGKFQLGLQFCTNSSHGMDGKQKTRD